jgi:hypothetical protein
MDLAVFSRKMVDRLDSFLGPKSLNGSIQVTDAMR